LATPQETFLLRLPPGPRPVVQRMPIEPLRDPPDSSVRQFCKYRLCIRFALAS